ncbi:hypothetical protein LTR70_005703 [Exophiala xenobiotica]|uniref:Nuclear distribution protein RO10 n=1 Tax=Lithohypha guttulata TaxID=1690604 RepID=A0ABR0KEN8_9EURO|nr:hypothetical protein LTR24_004086 [Lithohypha guttulata]KAK5317698.1 hypothetical protein LTR70_005703 [Exophiala xenobiotica]
MATEAAPTQAVGHSPILQNEPLDPTLTALTTLSLLNLRLSRLEHLLTGRSNPYSHDVDHAFTKPSADNGPSTSPSSDIPTQLRTLESRLTHLKRLDGLPGSLVRMVDSLRKEYPEIFPSTSTLTTSVQTSRSNPADPESVPVPKHELSQCAHEVLSHSTLYTSTSSRLQTLQTLRIPPATHSANLTSARPQLQQLKKRQEEIDAEVQKLRDRSAKVLEWWVKTGVVGMGELWEDWEGRVRGVEREVRWVEKRNAEDG